MPGCCLRGFDFGQHDHGGMRRQRSASERRRDVGSPCEVRRADVCERVPADGDAGVTIARDADFGGGGTAVRQAEGCSVRAARRQDEWCRRVENGLVARQIEPRLDALDRAARGRRSISRCSRADWHGPPLCRMGAGRLRHGERCDGGAAAARGVGLDVGGGDGALDGALGGITRRRRMDLDLREPREGAAREDNDRDLLDPAGRKADLEPADGAIVRALVVALKGRSTEVGVLAAGIGAIHQHHRRVVGLAAALGACRDADAADSGWCRERHRDCNGRSPAPAESGAVAPEQSPTRTAISQHGLCASSRGCIVGRRGERIGPSLREVLCVERSSAGEQTGEHDKDAQRYERTGRRHVRFFMHLSGTTRRACR